MFGASLLNGDPDWSIRAQAFEALEQLTLTNGSRLPWSTIQAGFECQGERVFFASRALGIFKPKHMTAALSVKTVVPRGGRSTTYRDQETGFDRTTGLFSYDMEAGRDKPANEFLRRAMERRAPLIYFRGVESGVYEPIWPVWVDQYQEVEGRVLLAAADTTQPSISSAEAALPSANEVRDASYSLALVRTRNHQAWFSSRTKAAYDYRCAFSRLPLRSLLVGAHIVPDAEDGPPSVNNGICMSTLHHAAFDAHLIGVDPDLRVHVADQVIAERDGPLLAALQGLNGSHLVVPADPTAHPNRDYLDQRYSAFLNARR